MQASSLLPEHKERLGQNKIELLAVNDPAAPLAGSADALVLDSYILGAQWERAARSRVGRIITLDDLGRPHEADVVIDPGYYPAPEARYPHCAPHAIHRLGPAYALVGPSFLARRPLSPRSQPAGQRLVISFGGTDPRQCTLEYAQAAAKLWPGELRVVVGAQHPQLGALGQLTSSSLRLVVGETDLAPTFSESDLFLGAGGGSTWERFCLGLPSVVVAVAPNQEEPARALAQSGYQSYLGRAEEVSASTAVHEALALLANEPRWQKMSAQAHGLVDGRGVERVLAEIHG